MSRNASEPDWTRTHGDSEKEKFDSNASVTPMVAGSFWVKVFVDKQWIMKKTPSADTFVRNLNALNLVHKKHGNSHYNHLPPLANSSNDLWSRSMALHFQFGLWQYRPFPLFQHLGRIDHSHDHHNKEHRHRVEDIQKDLV